ncbi:uncharacterized protein LOC129951923 [Eupeodes corollae]|uniref:uncharacterized protein LOC129951923 n=1 Tax=Eupeodes corollae TaxID=290404 RepID=UPI002492959E|nr:uncharacterized protein LOC129951923 [Eupeodes corollae]
MNGFSNPIYSRRKRFLPEYRELFAVLLKIPDEDVRNRVTDAINGIQNCPNCVTKIKQEYQVPMDVGTQTEDSYLQTIVIVDTEKDSTINKTDTIIIEKRRRKRKRNFPKVVKTAQHSSNVPVLKQDPNKSLKNTEDNEQQQQRPKLMRMDSNDDAVSMFFENWNSMDFNIDLEEKSLSNKNTLERVKYHMAIEWETCENKKNGFLPIHEAIVQNELNKLRRQIYVWKFRNHNLMDLTTEDDDNLIQLAVKENCMKSIIDELLKEDLDFNEVDNDNNNIIHLAVSHLSNDDDIKQQKQIIQTLESLLNKVDLKILLQRNDDGLTPLHIAVKKNEYLMAEKILNVIDKKLDIKSVAGLDDPFADTQKFSQYYCRQCDNFEGRGTNEFKQEILNAIDMKRGCSVLYFAMELGYEHLIYLLLAHMCNPTTKNLAGSDAKTYYTELGKNASIAGILENLITILHKQ